MFISYSRVLFGFGESEPDRDCQPHFPPNHGPGDRARARSGGSCWIAASVDDHETPTAFTRDEAEATAAHAELERENFEFLLGYEAGINWSDFLQQTENLRRDIGVPAGRVPATFLVAEDEGRIIGRVSIRHRLNEYLLSVGGHIGYAVLPAFRGRGYAGRILEAALVETRGLGVENVLLTCDADNLASKAAIERHGGVQEGMPDGGAKLRYWIGL